jgi:Uma2 family endonuclease
MTRAEFDAATALHPEVKRAERIEGRVYLQMSVSQLHGRAHAILAGWLMAYWARHPDCEVLAEGTARLGDHSDPQPGAMLRRVASGSSGVQAGFVVGPPELVVEMSASSASYALFEKKALYMRSGVLEYVVWQVYEERLDWFRLDGSEYVALVADENGFIESNVFPGLRLPVVALLAGDVASVMSAVR